MGKIRVSTLGSQEEEQLREKRKTQREEKKKRDSAKGRTEKVHISGMKGGERIKTVGAQSEEEIEKMARLTEEVEKDQSEGMHIGAIQPEDEKKAKKTRKRVRSKRYQEMIMQVEPQKLYSITDALTLLRKVSLTKFDPSVELHINVAEKGLRGAVTLPHGSGKQIKVAIADTDTIDKIIAMVEEGKIDFDALIAVPAVMTKLAKVARFLGPKGLMPNPKNGTISPTPEKVADKLKKGEINWKTETDFPLIHLVIGKLSFKDSQIEENFKALIKSIGDTKIKAVTLKSSMSPGIKVQVN